MCACSITSWWPKAVRCRWPSGGWYEPTQQQPYGYLALQRIVSPNTAPAPPAACGAVGAAQPQSGGQGDQGTPRPAAGAPASPRSSAPAGPARTPSVCVQRGQGHATASTKYVPNPSAARAARAVAASIR